MAEAVTSLSVAELRDVLDRALVAPKGIRIRTPSPGQATSLRQRIYNIRRQDHEASQTLYDPGHPSYDASPYDVITVSIEEGTNLILHKGGVMEIEEI